MRAAGCVLPYKYNREYIVLRVHIATGHHHHIRINERMMFAAAFARTLTMCPLCCAPFNGIQPALDIIL